MSKKKAFVNLNPPGKYYNNEKLQDMACYVIEKHFNLPGKIEKSFQVDVRVADDGEVRDINSKYLGRDSCTDVIAFSLMEGEPVPRQNPALLGQIIISSDTARRNARHYNHSSEKEMYLLFIHGMLHLAGWEEGPEIKKIQQNVLERFYEGK